MPRSNSGSDSSLTSLQPSGSGCTTPTSQKKMVTYICRWESCNIQLDTSADLADHVRIEHAQKQVDKGVKKYVCLWDGCKWFNTPSSSRSWLFKHVLPHCGDKPFRCLLAGCLMSFPTESGQLRHVQTHLSEQAVQKTPRSKEDSPGRMMKKKRLKFKRRFSQAKTDDFFDTCTMDRLHHQLVAINSSTQIDTAGHGRNILFHSQVVGKRVDQNDQVRVLLHWTPENILPDSWVNEREVQREAQRAVPMTSLSPETMRLLHPGLGGLHRLRKHRRK
ncbi:zinc finger protein AEBP2-like [Asterias amurensis]|uniref:zinc finger protein AEBP2-like n=1 Tax=Asterias amurensis TaxID=7602 RepID=UPI003AB850DA